MTQGLALLLHAGARIEWTSFTVHPSTAIGLGLLGALYAWRARQGTRQGFTLGRAKPAQFAAALLTMFVALNGWLHDLSDYYLFSAHMVQHMLLLMVVSPLLVMGTPGWMLRPALRVRPVAAFARAVTGAKATFAIFNLVLTAWHLPPLYNAAMASHEVHIVQHLTFMTAAVLMWWPVLSPLPELPRIAYPMQMLYLFLMTLPMAVVAIFITYADNVLYPAYASAPRLWGISPMTDQMLGGLIMWIPGGLYFFTVISVLFFRWQRTDDSKAGAQVDWRPGAVA